MSTWEERMSARAQERMRAEWERERARAEAEWAAEEAELEERYRPVREAGPPGGCHECWSWSGPRVPWGPWGHGGSVQPGPPPAGLDADSPFQGTAGTDWCWHSCHGDERPLFCGPIAYAAV